MKTIYTIFLVLLILVSIFVITLQIPLQKDLSILPEQSVPLTALLPGSEEIPSESVAEPTEPVAQNADKEYRLLQPLKPAAPVPAASTAEPLPQLAPADPVTLPPLPVPSPPPVSFIYFYQPPAVKPAVAVYYPASIQPNSLVVPVFIPQVVPSRFGMDKLVYPNGVVIKPKVYYPHQPVRNSFRAVTP